MITKLDNPEATALRKVSLRLIPFLWLMYFAAFLDRSSVGFAALQMNRDLGFSSYVYGLGAGIFFAGYCLFEVPSNLLLHRVGGRRWLARIMITWAFVAAAMVLVRSPTGFYALRFLLGVAEAGLFPGVIYYLTHWVPAERRARVVGMFMTAIPISTAIGGPVSTEILTLDGVWGISGWQWLFIIETLPSLVLGLVTLRYLPDTPMSAQWLSPAEKSALLRLVAAGRPPDATSHPTTVLTALLSPAILILCVCYFGVEIGLYGVLFWIPQIFAQAGIPPAAVGWAVAVPYTCAAVGMIWWSRRSDRHAERSWHLLAASVAGFLGLAASALLSDSAAPSVVAITIGAIGTLAVLPIFWTRPAALLGGAAAAGAIAMINAVGNVGGFVGPYVIGWLKEATGHFTEGLLVAGTGVLLTGVLTMLLGRVPRYEK